MRSNVRCSWATPGSPTASTPTRRRTGSANYHETLDLRLERADTVAFLDLPWWRCSWRAFLRGFRMPGELPARCHYTRWSRLRDEWDLAMRIWRENRAQPELEREIISQHGSHVALHVLGSKREVREFLGRVRGDRPGEEDV